MVQNIEIIVDQGRGKCTTDHISMAGPWLDIEVTLTIFQTTAHRGGQCFWRRPMVVNQIITGEYGEVPATARAYKASGSTMVVGDHNYGEGFFKRACGNGAASFRGLAVMVSPLHEFTKPI